MNKQIFAFVFLYIYHVQGMQKAIQSCEEELTTEQKNVKRNRFAKLLQDEHDILDYGNHGSVYKVIYPECEQKFAALKLMDDLKIQKHIYQNEICINKLFKGSSNIVQFFDSFIDTPEGQPGKPGRIKVNILLELGEKSLEKEILTPTGLIDSQPKIIKIFKDILTGIEQIHAKGIVHKDIFPKNIILFKNQAKIADFGVSGLSLEGREMYKNPNNKLFDPAFYGLGWMKVIEESEYKDIFWAGFILYRMMFNKELDLKETNVEYVIPAGTDSIVAKILVKCLTSVKKDQAKISELKSLCDAAIAQKAFKSLAKAVTVNFMEAAPDFGKMVWNDAVQFESVQILRKAFEVQVDKGVNTFKLNLPPMKKKKLLRMLSEVNPPTLEIEEIVSEKISSEPTELRGNLPKGLPIESETKTERNLLFGLGIFQIVAISLGLIYLTALTIMVLKHLKSGGHSLAHAPQLNKI